MKKSKKIKLITSLSTLATVSAVVPMVATACTNSNAVDDDDVLANPANSTNIETFLWVKRKQFNTYDVTKITAQIKQDNQVVFSQHNNLLKSVEFNIGTNEEEQRIYVTIDTKETQSQYTGYVEWDAYYVDPTPGPTPTPTGIVKTTYEELYDKYYNGTLLVGQKYQITDYDTVTNGRIGGDEDMAMSAYNHFDLIVTATTNSSFSEDAVAVASERDYDGYFDRTDFSKWTIKYCFDFKKATSYYEWAADFKEGGKGCIYYMKDEFGNEAPYDFKNIKFVASVVLPTMEEAPTDCFYTFTDNSDPDPENWTDASMYGSKTNVMNNVIKPTIYESTGIYGINASIILGTNATNNTFEENCARITLFSNELENQNARYNTFKDGSNLITMWGGQYNTFTQESSMISLFNPWVGNTFNGCICVSDPSKSGNGREVSRKNNTLNKNFIVKVTANNWDFNTSINTYGSINEEAQSIEELFLFFTFEKDRAGSTFIEGVEQPQTIKRIEYEDLLNLVEKDDLVVGQQYQIIDYYTTVNSEEGSKYENIAFSLPFNNQLRFDLIVTANTASTFYEDATAVENVLYGSSNKAIADFSKWKIKYDIKNNVDAYDWADDTIAESRLHNGKGVIYYMKDEYGNEAPYDFKNIIFNTDLMQETDAPVWSYTFDNANGQDASVVGSAHDNIILPYHETEGILSLNRIAFYGDNCYNNTFGKECANMVFWEGNSQYNTFGTECMYNMFGNNVSNNRFGNNFMLNVIGNLAQNNEFGNNCISNKFFNDTNATYYENNVFGPNISDITVGTEDGEPVLFSNNVMYNTSEYTFDYDVENAFIFNKTAITPEHNFHGASIGTWDNEPRANVLSTTTLSLFDWFKEATGIVWTITSQSGGLNAKVVDKTLTIQPQDSESELTYSLALSAAYNNVEVATLNLSIVVKAAA